MGQFALLDRFVVESNILIETLRGCGFAVSSAFWAKDDDDPETGNDGLWHLCVISDDVRRMPVFVAHGFVNAAFNKSSSWKIGPSDVKLYAPDSPALNHYRLNPPYAIPTDTCS